MRILAQFGSIYNTLVCSLLIFSKFTGEEHYMTMITLKTMPYLIKHMLITAALHLRSIMRNNTFKSISALHTHTLQR